MIRTPKQIDIEEFARRVERMCDFFLAQTEEEERNGSRDLKVIQDLREDAANIQFTHVSSKSFEGLDAYMSGVLTKEQT